MTFRSFASIVELRPGEHRGRLLVVHEPDVAHLNGIVVYVHPFAEEMNKCRRMAAQQARQMASAGYLVVQIDLLGCGDSGGDFSDATWTDWVRDVRAARDFAEHRAQLRWQTMSHRQNWLWGARAGAMLASQALGESCSTGSWGLLLWQPQASGKQVLQNFLRLKAAASLQESDPKRVLAAARLDLKQGRSVRVAGYELSAALAEGLSSATLVQPPHDARVLWIECSFAEDRSLLPSSASTVQAWRDDGVVVDARAVSGPQFWATVEVEDAPEFITTTLDMLKQTESAGERTADVR